MKSKIAALDEALKRSIKDQQIDDDEFTANDFAKHSGMKSRNARDVLMRMHEEGKLTKRSVLIGRNHTNVYRLA